MGSTALKHHIGHPAAAAQKTKPTRPTDVKGKTRKLHKLSG
ncbi:MAG: hypothetical protein ACI9P3_001535 [Bradyrhizobium sp.]